MSDDATPIPLDTPQTPWQRVNEIMDEADTIERLARLYREGGRTWDEAMKLAIERWKEEKGK